jgi:excisionase family DNA binding protein
MKLVDARAMAEALGVSDKTVYRLAGKGEIPHVRIGRSVRFDLEAVARFLKIASNVTERHGSNR